MGAGGPAKVKVPFTTADLDAWKEIAEGYRNDPSRVAKRFELIVKNQDPDWADVDLILGEMTETEKQLVLKTAQTHVQAQINGGALQGNVDNYIPLNNPHWDPNDERDYRMLKRYRDWIKMGLENAIPKAVNWSALYAVKQGQKETPTEFLDQLRNAMRKYTTLDPSSDVGQQQLVSLFLGQSSTDIRKKLQKLREPEIRNLEKLLEEAWRVFRNREDVDRGKLTRKMATATVAALEEKGMTDRREFRGRGRGRSLGNRGRLGNVAGRNQCMYCRKEGHWKNECPKLTRTLIAEAGVN